MVRQFAEALRAAPRGTSAFVFDVGANDGRWSEMFVPLAMEAAATGKRLALVMLEPQPRFRSTLQNLSARALPHNFTFYAAAAWKRETQLAFAADPTAKDPSGESAHLVPAEAGRQGEGAYSVRALDLAALLNAWLPPTGEAGPAPAASPLVLLKVDVEGGEFQLVPWLLLHGLLCRVSHLMIEWHLRHSAVGTRLGALSLRHSLLLLLREGCAEPPLAVFNDDYGPNNLGGLPVPGLHALTAHHQGKVSKGERVALKEHAAGDGRTQQQRPACFMAGFTGELCPEWSLVRSELAPPAVGDPGAPGRL